MKDVWHNPERCIIGGLGLAAYFLYLVYFREWVGVYEMLWACNSALVVACFGMLTYNKNMIACGVAMISLAHLLWIVDILCFLTMGTFPIGSAKYIQDPGTLTQEIVCTLHHLWFAPLCMWVLYKNGPLDQRGLVTSIFTSVALGVISRLSTPLWAPLPNGTLKYVNINMSHEMWKDVPVGFVHSFNQSHPIIYMAFALVLLNIGNFLCYQIWRVVYNSIFWSDEVHGSPRPKKKA